MKKLSREGFIAFDMTAKSITKKISDSLLSIVYRKDIKNLSTSFNDMVDAK